MMFQGPAGRRGFALPFTIFLVTLITLMLGVAFSRSAVEVQISDGSDATISALAVAQGGLFAFLGDTFAVRPTPGDSIRYNVAGGYAWVLPTEFQVPADTINNPIVYVVRSAGYLIHPNQGSTPQAQRTVVQFARWQSPPSIPSVPALLTSANGVVRVTGGSPNELNVWAANTCGSGAPDIRVFYTLPGPLTLDGVSGFPGITDPSPATIAASAGVDWSQVASGNFRADYNSIQFNDTTYSSQLVNGNATITMPDNGTGLLIVTGNLYVTGSGISANDVTWNGIILVGGQIIARSEFFALNGVLVTGLNASMTPPVSQDSLAGPGRDVDLQYDPCEVSKALRRLRGFAALPRTWVDNWATY